MAREPTVPAQACAQTIDRTHVHFVERSQQRLGVLRFDQTLAIRARRRVIGTRSSPAAGVPRNLHATPIRSRRTVVNRRRTLLSQLL